MRTTNTFGIQFIIRMNKLKENLAPIYCRVTVDSHRVEISLKHWIDPKDWNSAKGMARGSREEIKSLNHFLEEVKARLMECYQEMQIQKQLITAEAIKNKFCGNDVSSGHEQIKEDIDNLKKNNFNAIYVKASEINEEVLNVCDQTGVYVMVDITPGDYLEPAYPATLTDILTQLLFMHNNHPSLTCWVLRDVEDHLPRYDEIFKVLTMHSVVPVMIITSDHERLKPVWNRAVIAGIEYAGGTDILGEIKKYVDYPFILFNKSDDWQSLKLENYINRMAHGNPTNLQGIVFNKTGFTHIEEEQSGFDTLKYKLADVEMEWISNTQYSIYFKNNYQYTNLSEFTFALELFQGDKRVSAKSLNDIDLAPGKSTLYGASLDYSVDVGEVYELRITCRLRNDKPWAVRGHIINQKSVWIGKNEELELKHILHNNAN